MICSTFVFLFLIILLLIDHILTQEVNKFEKMSIPQSLWTPNQTLMGVPFRVSCATMCTARGQCQFAFDQALDTCQIGSVPIYNIVVVDDTAPYIDIFYKVQPVNYTWGPYSNWTACNESCGYGHQERNRTCAAGDPCSAALSAPSCEGPDTEVQGCYSGQGCTTTHIPYFDSTGVPHDLSLNPTLSPNHISLPNNNTYISGGITSASMPVVDNGVLDCEQNNALCYFGQFGGGGANSSSSSFVYHSTRLVSRYLSAIVNLRDRSLWVLGGYGGGALQATTEVWNPGNRTWTYGPVMPSALYQHSAVALDDINDAYMVLGGYDATDLNYGVWTYTWSESTWTPMPSMPVAVRFAGIAAFTKQPSGETIVVVAGAGTSTTSLSTFSLLTQLWTTGSTLPFFNAFMVFYNYQGQIFALAGNRPSVLQLDSSDLVTWINRTDLVLAPTPNGYTFGAGYQYCPKNCDLATCASINTAYTGLDFNTSQSNVTSASACKDLCQHMAGCPFYSYNNAISTCYFKTTNTSISVDSAYTSGPATCGCLEVGMSYSVANYLNVIANMPDAEMCQWYCIQDVNCYFFTYYTRSYADSTKGMNCYTLGWPAIAAPNANGVISGVKICP